MLFALDQKLGEQNRGIVYMLPAGLFKTGP